MIPCISFKSMQPEGVVLCRKVCIDAVLHTDMTKHFSILCQMKSISQSQEQGSAVPLTGSDILPFVLHFMVKDPIQSTKTVFYGLRSISFGGNFP